MLQGTGGPNPNHLQPAVTGAIYRQLATLTSSCSIRSEAPSRYKASVSVTALSPRQGGILQAKRRHRQVSIKLALPAVGRSDALLPPLGSFEVDEFRSCGSIAWFGHIMGEAKPNIRFTPPSYNSNMYNMSSHRAYAVNERKVDDNYTDILQTV